MKRTLDADSSSEEEAPLAGLTHIKRVKSSGSTQQTVAEKKKKKRKKKKTTSPKAEDDTAELVQGESHTTNQDSRHRQAQQAGDQAATTAHSAQRSQDADSSDTDADANEFEVLASDHVGIPRSKKDTSASQLARRRGTSGSSTTTPGAQLGRSYTVSLAVPVSAAARAASHELRTILAGQIARAAVLFNVDEIVVYRDETAKAQTQGVHSDKALHPERMLLRVLQYLECPQYLRKHLFPRHPDLKFVGLLSPLDTPHHMRVTEVSTYREGVVVNRPVKKGQGSWVDVGLRQPVQIDRLLTAGVRVTVKLSGQEQGKRISGVPVAPSTPRTESGTYWGYSVRLAPDISSVFSGCPFKGGYDLKVGIDETSGLPASDAQLPSFRHAIIMFGGPDGLASTLETDESVGGIEDVFDLSIKSCSHPGTASVRLEESMLMSLSALNDQISSSGVPK